VYVDEQLEKKMKGRFLIKTNEQQVEKNIYADKSALILAWLLREGVSRREFSLREVAKGARVSLGLVQRVFETLALKGLLQVEGIRTAKKFIFTKPNLLLESWLDHYDMAKKCKMRTYHSALQGKEELLGALKKSKLNTKAALALHSAAEAYGYKNTNLNTFEIYMLDPSIRSKLEKTLQLEARERGYEVLLVEPYYESLLKQGMKSKKGINVSPILLTYLDLYYFPLRGQEQAEFMKARAVELQRIYKKISGHAKKSRR